MTRPRRDETIWAGGRDAASLGGPTDAKRSTARSRRAVCNNVWGASSARDEGRGSARGEDCRTPTDAMGFKTRLLSRELARVRKLPALRIDRPLALTRAPLS